MAGRLRDAAGRFLPNPVQQPVQAFLPWAAALAGVGVRRAWQWWRDDENRGAARELAAGAQALSRGARQEYEGWRETFRRPAAERSPVHAYTFSYRYGGRPYRRRFRWFARRYRMPLRRRRRHFNPQGWRRYTTPFKRWRNRYVPPAPTRVIRGRLRRRRQAHPRWYGPWQEQAAAIQAREAAARAIIPLVAAGRAQLRQYHNYRQR